MAESLTVLIVGGGGREHALAWRLHQENPSARILAAPGNPGIAELATCVPVRATDFAGLAALARQEGVDWTLVGPEAPLAAGLVDAFRAESLPIFGPTRAAAAIETSKAFAKELMVEANVPTARARTCRSIAVAERAIDELADDAGRVVVKASGLAAGKGVIVAPSRAAARQAAAAMLSDRTFGDAGDTVLVEEFMDGEELSLFAITDGERVITLPASQDHKRLRDGDRGPNTGGMGAYSPVSIADAPGFNDDVVERIVRPTLATLAERGATFTGLLYVGLMVTASVRRSSNSIAGSAIPKPRPCCRHSAPRLACSTRWPPSRAAAGCPESLRFRPNARRSRRSLPRRAIRKSRAPATRFDFQRPRPTCSCFTPARRAARAGRSRRRAVACWR